MIHGAFLSSLPMAITLACTAGAADVGEPVIAGDPPPQPPARVQIVPRPLAPEPNPYTVGAGRFAIEFDAVNYTRNRVRGVRTTTLEWPLTLRIGIFHNLELQTEIETFVWQRTRQDRDTDTSSGFGDITLRPKFNAWGNDRAIYGGRTALAVMPYVKFPTERHGLGSNVIEGGITFPWDINLARRLTLEVTPDIGIVRGQRDDGRRRSRYDADFATLFSLNYHATDALTPFAEFFGARSTEPGGSFIGVVRTGITSDIGPRMVIEPAVAFGVTSAAADYNFSLTLIHRF